MAETVKLTNDFKQIRYFNSDVGTSTVTFQDCDSIKASDWEFYVGGPLSRKDTTWDVFCLIEDQCKYIIFSPSTDYELSKHIEGQPGNLMMVLFLVTKMSSV